MRSAPSDRDESLWRLTFSPAIWAAHFVLSYVTAAVWCAKLAGADGSLAEARAAIAIYTGVALAGIAASGYRAYRMHRLGDADAPHDDDTPEDRHRFLGFASFLLSAMSALATLYVGLVVVFVRTCH